MHARLGGLEHRLVRPDLPGEDDLLARLGGHRAPEVGLLAVGDEILPALDDLEAPEFLEEPRPALGPASIGFQLALRHGDHQTADVHGSGSFTTAWLF